MCISTPIKRIKTPQGKIIRYAKVSIPDYAIPTVHSDYNGPMRSRNIHLRNYVAKLANSHIHIDVRLNSICNWKEHYKF